MTDFTSPEGRLRNLFTSTARDRQIPVISPSQEELALSIMQKIGYNSSYCVVTDEGLCIVDNQTMIVTDDQQVASAPMPLELA